MEKVNQWVFFDTKQIVYVKIRKYRIPKGPKPGYGFLSGIELMISVRLECGEVVNLYFSYDAIKNLLTQIGSGIRKIFRDFKNSDERNNYILRKLKEKKMLSVFITRIVKTNDKYEMYVGDVV